MEKKIDRKTLLVCIGGGVIGDLVGLTASVLLRGVDFVQMPTTLLSQVDSSVGGKTAINSKFGKNLIGTFYQPKSVLISLKTSDAGSNKLSWGFGVPGGTNSLISSQFIILSAVVTYPVSSTNFLN